MGEIVRVRGLEIDQDLAAQEREWKAIRVGWVLFALLLLAGLAGLLGHGPLARAEARSEGGLEAEYARFARYRDPERLHLRARAGDRGELRLWIAGTTLEGIEIERLRPEPSRVEPGDGRSVHVFDAGGADELAIEIAFEHRRVGPFDLSLGVEGGPELRLSTFVYP